jgi:eukaryotic-like serine/threonine-protein kinase
MVAQTSQCDPRRLKQLLAGDLSDRVEQQVTQHVETCESCRCELETIAADNSWWQDARQFLSSTVLSSTEVSCLIDDSPTSGNTINLREIADEVDTTPDEMILDCLAPSDNPAMLGRLGSYEILEVIGRGGMGLVFKAYDGELNRYLAIKVLLPCYASSAAARKRFAREAQAAAAVVHQHVVGIHGVEGSGKLPYLVMPFVACESLQERIDREGPLDTRDILRIAMQAAQGLDAAHAQGLIHRDVKPANILLEKSVDRVLLTDFGLARAIDDASLTGSGIIAGTPQYMSPEQAKGESIDHRADLFSLGSVVYAMCTGRSPFRAETTMGVLRRICDGEARNIQEVNAEIPDWLTRIVDRLHTKSPADRFESADEVATLLEQCLAHVQHPTAVSLPDSVVVRRRSRIGRYVVGGLLVVTCLVVIDVGRNKSSLFRQDGTKTPELRRLVPAYEASDTDPANNKDYLGWSDELDREVRDIDARLQMLETEDS